MLTVLLRASFSLYFSLFLSFSFLRIRSKIKRVNNGSDDFLIVAENIAAEHRHISKLHSLLADLSHQSKGAVENHDEENLC